MKPKASLRFLLCSATLVLIAAPSLQAITYYWDNNGATAGFGTAAGTWAVPTTGDASQGWGTSNTGALLPADVTTTTSDTVNFGTGTAGNGLAAGSITVSGTVETGNMTFGSQSGAITLSGGIISLGGGRTITASNSGNVISSELALTGATTISLNAPGGTGVPPRTLTLGVLSGSGGLTLQNTAGQNPNPATFILNGQSSYSGNTLLDSTNTNANIELRLGIDNALPTATILTIDGGNGTGSGRTGNFNMNGQSQTLAGLTNTVVSLRTQNVLNASETLSTLTISDSGNRTFSGRIGAGGTNIAIVKQGAGTWTLSGANSYDGATTISEGAINIRHATALGGTTNGTSVATGAALQIQNNISIAAETLTLNGTGVSNTGALRNISGTNTFNGAITLGSDSQINSDAGTLTLGGGITGTGFGFTKAGSGALTLSAASDYTGLTTIDGGAIVVQDASALGTTDAGTVVNGTNTGNAANARLDLSGGVTVTGEALTISGVGNFTGALTSTTGNNVWAGDVTIGAAGTRLGASAGASLEVSGMIDSGANPHGLVIRTTDLTGSVILSGANTYLGDTQVLIGKLQLAGGDNRLPVGTNLILSSGGTNPDAEFDLNGRNQEVAGLSLTGTATKNSVNNSSGTISTLTVNTAASSPSTYGGILQGNLALTKTGADTLTLADTSTNNTYTGATNVDQGTLIVNGNISTSLLTTVSDAATLGGGGAVGALAFEGGSFFDIFDAADNADPLAATTITFSTTGFGIDNLVSQGVAVDWFSIANGTYTLITGTLDNTNLDNFGLANAYDIGGGRSAYFQSGSLQLVIVPEPHAALLGGIGVLLIFRRRRA